MAHISVVAYTRDDARQAWTKRRSDLGRLADVGDTLSEIDQRIADLQKRVNILLNARLAERETT